jgi:transposase-like protein
MIRLRPKLFRGLHFQDEIIVLCARWYRRYRDLEEGMAKRRLSVDHIPP